MRAAGYIRVSTDEQAREGVSLGDQEQRIRDFTAEREWECVEVFADRGVSGSVPFAERPAGAQAFAADVDRIVVVAWDRLSRDAADFLAVARDREVVSITEHGEPTLLRDLRAVLAQEERRKISERTAAAAKALARNGRYNGPRPCGYRFEDGLLVPVDHEREIVRRVFSEFVAGRSRRQITRDLNAEDVPTVRGGRWREATVASVLANPVYIGRVRFHGREFDGIHEPILDGETWDRAHALLTATRKGKGRGRRPVGQHLFVSGMLRCGACGEAMVPRTNGGYEDYLCNGRMSYGADFCGQGTVRRREIDSAVYSYFEQVGLDVDATRRELAENRDRQVAEASSLLAVAEREVQRADERLARVRRDYLDGSLGATDWQELRAELDGERAGAEAEAVRLRERVTEIEQPMGDAEQETLEHLTSIRAAMAGQVIATQGIESVRAALSRLFEGFVLHAPDAGPLRLHAELAFIAGYVVEPVIRGDVANPLIPDRREALSQTKNGGAWPSGFTAQPFAPIPVIGISKRWARLADLRTQSSTQPKPSFESNCERANPEADTPRRRHSPRRFSVRPNAPRGLWWHCT